MSQYNAPFEIHVHGDVPLRADVTYAQLQDALKPLWNYAGAKSLADGAEQRLRGRARHQVRRARSTCSRMCWTVAGDEDFRQSLDEMCMSLNELAEQGAAIEVTFYDAEFDEEEERARSRIARRLRHAVRRPHAGGHHAGAARPAGAGRGQPDGAPLRRRRTRWRGRPRSTSCSAQRFDALVNSLEIGKPPRGTRRRRRRPRRRPPAAAPALSSVQRASRGRPDPWLRLCSAHRSLAGDGAMALFSQDALNPGVRKREVFGWAMYDFANSGYTTVVITAVFAAYFVGGIARQGRMGHLRLDGGAQHLLRDRDAHHAQHRRLCRPARGQEARAGAGHRRLRGRHRGAGARAGPGAVALAMVLIIVSNTFYSYGESLTAAFLPELARPEVAGQGERLGLGLRLLRRHAGAGHLPGLRAVGAGAAASRPRSSCRSRC